MLTKKTKRVGSLLICIAMIISLAFTITACGSNNDDNPAIKVTCKPWTEQLILGNMLMSLLEENGYPVEDRLGLGEDPVIRPALHSGEVDVYWEYTGTTLITLMEHDVVTDPQEAYNLVKEWDETNNEVTWLKYATANNTYTLMMRQAQAKELGIESISDLASYIKENPNEITLGTNNEFYERADGIKAIEETYAFEFGEDNMVFMDTGLTYSALKEGEVDVAMGFGTDGRIPAFELVNLVDDKNFFPVYNPAPVIRMEVLETYPDVKEVIEQLSPLLDQETLANLNKKVDVDGEEPEKVAQDFLKEHGLIE